MKTISLQFSFYFIFFLFILWTCRAVWISFLYYSNHCMILCLIKYQIQFKSSVLFTYTVSIHTVNCFSFVLYFSYFFAEYSFNILQSPWMRSTIKVYQILSNICVYIIMIVIINGFTFFLMKIKWMVRIAYWKMCVNSRSIEIETETFSKIKLWNQTNVKQQLNRWRWKMSSSFQINRTFL